jgi:hypothetical protein
MLKSTPLGVRTKDSSVDRFRLLGCLQLCGSNQGHSAGRQAVYSARSAMSGVPGENLVNGRTTISSFSPKNSICDEVFNPDYSSVLLRSRVWRVTCWFWCWNCRIAQSAHNSPDPRVRIRGQEESSCHGFNEARSSQQPPQRGGGRPHSANLQTKELGRGEHSR